MEEGGTTVVMDGGVEWEGVKLFGSGLRSESLYDAWEWMGVVQGGWDERCCPESVFPTLDPAGWSASVRCPVVTPSLNACSLPTRPSSRGLLMRPLPGFACVARVLLRVPGDLDRLLCRQ